MNLGNPTMQAILSRFIRQKIKDKSKDDIQERFRQERIEEKIRIAEVVEEKAAQLAKKASHIKQKTPEELEKERNLGK